MRAYLHYADGQEQKFRDLRETKIVNNIVLNSVYGKCFAALALRGMVIFIYDV